MKKCTWWLAMVLACSITMLAQTSTESGEHAHHKGKMAAGGPGTLTGCLSGPNDEGAYVLTNAHGKKVEVGGSDDLKAHVGHQVKLTGAWAKSGAEIGEKEKDEKKEAGEKGEKAEMGERHFKVTKIDHVADTCKQASASAAGEHHHEAAAKTPK